MLLHSPFYNEDGIKRAVYVQVVPKPSILATCGMTTFCSVLLSIQEINRRRRCRTQLVQYAPMVMRQQSNHNVRAIIKQNIIIIILEFNYYYYYNTIRYLLFAPVLMYFVWKIRLIPE